MLTAAELGEILAEIHERSEQALVGALEGREYFVVGEDLPCFMVTPRDLEESNPFPSGTPYPCPG